MIKDMDIALYNHSTCTTGNQRYRIASSAVKYLILDLYFQRLNGF